MSAEVRDAQETDPEVEATVEDMVEDTRMYTLLTFNVCSRSRSPRRRHRDRSVSHSRDTDLKEGRCFGCGRKGHIKRDCPEGRGRGRSRSPQYRDKKRDRSSRRKSRSYSSASSRRGKYDKRRKSSSRSVSSRRSYSPDDRRRGNAERSSSR